MRNSLNTLKGMTTQTDVLSGASYTWFSQQWQRSVTAASLVKGDRKAPNPWSYTVDSFQGAKGDYAMEYPPGRLYRTVTGQLIEGGPPLLNGGNYVSIYFNAYNQALGRLNSNVRGSLDLAVSLAEAGQAVRMLNLVARFKAGVADMANSYMREVARGIETKRNSARGRRNLARDLDRWQKGLSSRYPGSYQPVPLNPGLVSRASSLLANGWCEFTYGWSPLVSDIYGIASNVCNHVRNNDVVKAKVRQVINVTTQEEISYLGATPKGPCRHEGFCGTTISIRLKPNWDTGLAKWSSLNPLSVAWELVPYSFVVDWFLDIGSYMRNLETALLYDNRFRDGFVSRILRYETNHSVDGRQQPFAEVYRLKASAGRTYVHFERSVLTSYPLPELPSFQVDLGSNQLLSAAALLRQLLR